MNILVTLDANYLPPLRNMMFSLFENNLGEKLTIYVVHSSLEEGDINDLAKFANSKGSELIGIKVPDHYFSDAPLLLHYTKEMYFRLLAYKILPDNLDRVLYIDPDTLVLNSIKELYNLDITDYLYAAASHDILTIKEINQLRFYPYEIESYYNSGVLLLNLEKQRKEVSEEEIFDFVDKNRSLLIMPDQDILNILYAKKIKSLNEILYNYDARYYRHYKLKTKGEVDIDYILNNTVVLHFCGKRKPWHKNYFGKFHVLYKHYEKRTRDYLDKLFV